MTALSTRPDVGPRSVASRRRRRELWWVAGVVLFTLARFVVAYGTLRRYDLNIWLFGAVDLGTAVPYGVGTARVATSVVDRRYPAAARWTVVAAASFLAPYLYVALAGEAMPTVVFVVLGVLVAALGANAVVGVRSKVRSLRHNRSSNASAVTGLE